jgi:hypothetical protein
LGSEKNDFTTKMFAPAWQLSSPSKLLGIRNFIQNNMFLAYVVFSSPRDMIY